MFDRNSKEGKNIEVSLGLLVGYILAGFINTWLTGKPYQESFLDEKIITAIAGIGLALFLYNRNKAKIPQEEE
ncbi:MAG: hypothetical protein KTR30_12410 [Saprospiraceae bacterium]|nr:hypothetical protein [Saprospiraceae bacterium]